MSVLPAPWPSLLLEIGNHPLEVADTLIAVGEFLVIFVAARALAELMVRLQLPTILGELVAGVLIGVSGLHLIVPPETQGALSQWAVSLMSSLSSAPADAIQELYRETFPNLQAVSRLGLFALYSVASSLYSKRSCSIFRATSTVASSKSSSSHTCATSCGSRVSS